MECQNCGVEFAPKNEQQKYCCNTCRMEAFYARKAHEKAPVNGTVNGYVTPVKTPVNSPYAYANNVMMTEDTLNRILSERDKAHAQEIARLEAEFKARTLEQRIIAIEEKIKEDEGKGLAGLGIALPELIQMAASLPIFNNPPKA